MGLDREFVADTFIRGQGIEIGALHMPLRVPRSAKVKYVDRLSVDDLRKQYPELDSKGLVNVDIIADGERLEPIENDTQDFVIANHFLEHCQNPVGALMNMFRTLKPGGILYLAIPDKRCSFDAERPVTTLEHVMKDYNEGPAWSRRQHFEEWTRLVNKVQDDEEAEKQTAQNMNMDYSIHYHVWTQAEMLELIVALRNMVNFEVELCLSHESEVIFILRKGKTSFDDADEFRQMLDRKLSPEPWCIDSISFDGDTLEMTGWALAPGGRHSDLSFTVNDRPFELIEFPIPRSDIANVFWYKAGADKAAFRCRTSITPDEFFKDGYASLKCITAQTGSPLRPEHNWYYPDDRAAAPLPDAQRRKRVAGNEDAEIFRLEGYTTFKKLDFALRKVQSRGIGEFPAVLDWGCGCGRMARYFYALPKVRLTGIDIDSDNLNWCEQHLGFAQFQPAALRPPTRLESASFDLLIGISVFSHLTERDQFEWLSELRRIAKPGAYLLMSVLGETTVCQSPWDRAQWDAWQRAGIFYVKDNDDLKGYVEDDNYYCNTYITTEYIRRNWTRYFDVIDITPAYIGNQQDLVILRKPE